jgi:CHAD domain-containing protein
MEPSIQDKATMANPEGTDPALPPVELLASPGILPDEPMSEAGRKVLRFHYRRMVFHEPGTRQGEDVEALHDMRVATRRMRAALRVFGTYYKPKARARFRKGLRRTGQALGPVRDLDVFRTKIAQYQVTLPDSQRGDLERFLNVLEARRDTARERMIRYLDGDKYALFVERFGLFVETEGQGSRSPEPSDRPVPYRVCHVVPMAVYRRLAAVRAFDEWVTIPNPPPSRLHQLRISCKRLRYTLEFFKEVLGPSTGILIKEIVAVQDHLGSLQDAVVAGAILGEYLSEGIWRQLPGETGTGVPAVPVGVQVYLSAKEAEKQSLIASFPEIWQRIVNQDFSRMVAESVAVL